MQLVKKYIGVVLGKISSIGISFIFLYLITNSYSNSSSGEILLVVSIINLLISISRFGQDQVIVKKNNSFNANYEFFSSLSIVLVTSILLVFVILIINYFGVFPITKTDYPWIYFSAIPLSLLWVIIGYFRSNNLQFLSNFSENGLFYLVFLIAFVFSLKSISAFNHIFLLSAFASLIILLFLSKLFGVSFKISKSVIIYNFSLGFKIMTSSIFSFFIINMPIYLAGIFNLFDDITLYSVCLKVSLIVNIGMSIVNSLYSPKYANAFKNKNFVHLKKYYTDSRKELILISLIPVILIILFPKFILGFFNLSEVEDSSLIIMFSICQFICISTGTTGAFLNIVDREKILRKNTLIGFFISLLFGLSFFFFQNIYIMFLMFGSGVLFENILSFFSVKSFFKQNV